MSHRQLVAVVGPLPPPAHGGSIMTEAILRSELSSEYRLHHVDTSDHREIANVGRFDLRNVLLAIRHTLAFARALLRRPAICYIPIAASRLGFVRDALLLLPARLMRRRRVVHLHARGFSEFYASGARWLQVLVRLSLGGHTHAIVLGESRRHEFAALLPEALVHVVPNGIKDHAGPEAAGGLREPIVLHLATLSADKGVFEVLEVARRTRVTLPHARFMLAGPWLREEERLRALAYVAQHGLSERVALVGPVAGTAKLELLQGAAVMAFPSRYVFEAHPLVLLEALCSGVPVVATNVGCIPEIISDGREGFLVNATDLDALTSRVVQLLRDEDLRYRMAQAARRRYEEAFTLDLFVRRLGDVWRVVLGEDAPSPQRVGRLSGRRNPGREAL